MAAVRIFDRFVALLAEPSTIFTAILSDGVVRLEFTPFMTVRFRTFIGEMVETRLFNVA